MTEVKLQLKHQKGRRSSTRLEQMSKPLVMNDRWELRAKETGGSRKRYMGRTCLRIRENLRNHPSVK
ncbi:hypothetical protein KCU71_g32, partial [Aureobasidium melanogenum]